MIASPTLGVVIVAAGSGLRFGDAGKALALLGGKPLLVWSLALFAALPETHEIVVVAGEHTHDDCEALLRDTRVKHASVVIGGATRAESVRLGLFALRAEVSHVAIHDAARPLATAELVQRVIDAAMVTGAAIPVVPVSDTLHAIGPDGTISSTPDRAGFRAAQTPQVARRDWLDAAYRAGVGTTDDGGLLHAAGYPVALVDGDPGNLKITWPADLTIAAALLAAREERR
jgi:2-C-methyl-D-erythritol 4-phosphate cytidylyltransferase